MKEPWEFQEQVALGMKELDRQWPGWESVVDLDRLSLESDCRCVLGQMFGDYSNGIDELGGPVPWNGMINLKWAADRGFHIGTLMASNHEPKNPEWRTLTDAWRQAIRERRGES